MRESTAERTPNQIGQPRQPAPDTEPTDFFIVTIDPAKQEAFECLVKGTRYARIGTVTEQPVFVVRGLEQNTILDVALADLKTAWKKTFGNLI